MFKNKERHGSVMVSTSALRERVLSSRLGPGMGMLGVKTWLSTLETVYSLDDHVNVSPISFNWGCKRTIEDDMHPGSDHPQCQHIKVGLVIMFCKKLVE